MDVRANKASLPLKYNYRINTYRETGDCDFPDEGKSETLQGTEEQSFA